MTAQAFNDVADIVAGEADAEHPLVELLAKCLQQDLLLGSGGLAVGMVDLHEATVRKRTWLSQCRGDSFAL